MGIVRSLAPLPRQRTYGLRGSRLRFVTSRDTSSVTRMPVAYNSSSMALSRLASGVDRRAGCSRSSSISLGLIALGRVFPTLGELSPSVGFEGMIDSAARNPKKERTAAILRATEVSL